VLPRVVERDVDGRAVRGFPAFVDAGTAVELRVFATPGQQQQASGPGIRRLLRLDIPAPAKSVERQLDPRTRLLLGTNPDGSLSALIDDCADAAVDASLAGPVWTREEFAALRDRISKVLVSSTLDIVGRAAKALAAAHAVQLALPAEPRQEHAEAITDIRAQLDRLLPPRFVTYTGAARLTDLTRYLTAIGRRLEQLPRALNADHERMARVHAVQDAYDELLRALPPPRRSAPDVQDIGWQIEELRVSLWAQQLGTPRPISEQRIYRAIDRVAEGD
jgi:ATP-dependent helicase HrpA